jgi:indolepyruvate decarboxylase
MSISIGDYLLARLSEMEVRPMFGVPGDFNLRFLEQTVRNSSINFVGCCNELSAAYAADGYARLAGISALVTTYGVGEPASLSGVAGAYAERIPIVCAPSVYPAEGGVAGIKQVTTGRRNTTSQRRASARRLAIIPTLHPLLRAA